MKNLLFLFFLFTVIVKAQPIINGPSPINICDDNNTGFAVFNLETKNAEILGTLNPNEYAVSYHITLQNANQNSNPLPLLFTNTVYSYQVIFVRVQENADPTNYATTVLYLDVVELPPFPAIIPNVTLYENPYDGVAVFNFTEQSTILLNGYDSNEITYHTSLVDAQNGSNPIPNPNAYTGTNLQTIWARNQNIPTECFDIRSFQLKVFDSNLIVFITDTRLRTMLFSSSASNSIAKDLNGVAFDIDVNNDDEIQKSEALLVGHLNLNNYNIPYLNRIQSMAGIEFFTNLVTLNCSSNRLTSINVQSLTNLTNLNCKANMLTALNVGGLTNLHTLDFEQNSITSISLLNSPTLVNLDCSTNQLTTLNVQNCINLQTLTCRSNLLTTLNLQGLTNLQMVSCEQNQLTSLNIQGVTNLQTLYCHNNSLTVLNAQGLESLNYLYCNNNQIATLNVEGLTNLYVLHCQNNQLSNLNFENLTSLTGLYCSYNPLYTLNIKNGINMGELQANNTGLYHVCVDESELDYIVFALGNPNCQVNSYCNFIPGGDYYVIEGNNKFDANENGCDDTDNSLLGLKFNITGDANAGTFIYNTSGNYSIPVQAGNHIVTPQLENPTYFSISPSSLVANFPTQASPLIQDFCITPNGVHHDVEVVFLQTSAARPGFDATYAIVYKNKGNQIENGTITLNFNDSVLDFINSNLPSISQSLNTLVWNYNNLLPFESRSINLAFSVNTPTQTPAVNIGDQLNYSATITLLTTDEFLSDNTSLLNQTVVGSYDPNDKTCIEGTTVSPNMIGQYVHYVIRFENTGTFFAENVVIKDQIDLIKFDITTLIPLHSSHNFVTRINGGKVEFIFEGINLPFDDATNDGYVAFKIKTIATLVLGDEFTNTASIYFDFNFPIITNTTSTTVVALNVQDFDFNDYFTLFPNPVKEVLNIKNNEIIGVKSVAIYNTLGQLVLVYTNAANLSALDVSQLKTGTYFIKLATDKGAASQKFIKE